MSKSILTSTSSVFNSTPSSLQWKLDADALLAVKAELDALEDKYNALKSSVLKNPLAEEYLNGQLGSKIQFFPETVTVALDPVYIVNKLTKADIAKVATFSKTALDKAGFAGLAQEAEVAGPVKSAFLKVTKLTKDDKVLIASGTL
jgi:hypothetical protein